MADSPEKTLRLPAEMLARVDRLVKVMSGDPELAPFGAVDRATVLRLAVGCGLKVIEDEYELEREPPCEPAAG